MAKKLNITPLHDRVIIKPAAAEEKTASGIYIPDTAKEKPQKGTIIAVGPGTKDEKITVKVGDSVGVFVGPAMTKTWMNNIVTVSDAYKAFLGHSQTDISGTPNFFTLPVLEKKVGKVTNNANYRKKRANLIYKLDGSMIG